jgi:NADPH-ferrihemoprotein reductase
LGLFSSFTKDLKARIPTERSTRFYVQAKLHDSGFKMPTKPKTPMILFANGAGVGIMRSIIQEKLNSIVEGNHNHNIGTISLFFGTRTTGDFLFKGDFETAARARALKEFKVAFSRQSVSIVKY